jgi:DNA ligase (NAD+)
MMDIEWIGDAIIEAMVDNQIISHFTDLFKLITDPSMRMIVKNLPGMGEKKIEIIIQWLEKSKSKELYKIIYALGIPQVGEKTAKILSDTIRDYSRDDLLGRPNNGQNNGRFSHTNLISFLSDRSFLEEIHSIGPETCNNIIDRMNNTHNWEALALLSSYGVDFSNFGSEIIRESEKLQYVRFAISGTFQISRDQIISLLVKQGATYCPNITKNTNLLIIWINPSSKVSKASKQDIEVIEGLDAVEKKLDVDFELKNIGLF